MTLRDLRRTDFTAALARLDREDDINKVLRFFSYEHFYVIYCKVRLSGPRRLGREVLGRLLCAHARSQAGVLPREASARSSRVHTRNGLSHRGAAGSAPHLTSTASLSP